MKRTKKLLKPIMVLAVLAVLVGAPAYGAGLAKNSVRSKHIKDGNVATVDLAPGAVTNAKIADGAVDSGAILNGSLNGDDIADNGIDGDEIFNGSVSDLDIALLTLRTNTGSVTAGSAAVVSVNCLSGETAISVGSNWDGASTVGPVYIAASNLSGSGGAGGAPSGASVTGRNDGAGSRTLTAQVLCLS